MLLTLINDLLDLAKQQKFTFQFNLSFFDLVNASKNAFKTLEFLAKTKQIRTIVDHDPAQSELLQRIFGDENRFEQIFLNLVSNALKFTNQDGTVRIGLSCSLLDPITDAAKIRKAKLSLENNEIFEKVSGNSNFNFLSVSIRVSDTGRGISPEGL
mmetsp:Transcript_12667/g.19689  ORF Transcript_12667/g.19689 Transcript_12667/m.19689 type:complete len:156 (+) Transcript_12667:1130-1597(+)